MEPASVKQALSQPLWVEAMKQEYGSLIANNTWSLTTLPANKKTVGRIWVFRIKENPDGTINKYKACLVAKGYN